jgi:hypothetical protein
MNTERVRRKRTRWIAPVVAVLLTAAGGVVTPAHADGWVSVSPTGDTHAELVSVSGTANAYSGAVAVSATGSATGPTAVSGTMARRAAGQIAFQGEAVLPTFPCPLSPPTGDCGGGTFRGTWTGEVAGMYFGSSFAANWTTLTGEDVSATFRYWEQTCLGGAGTLAGSAGGNGSAGAAANEVQGWWQERNEVGVRAIVGVTFGFAFRWDRYLNSAAIDLYSTSLTLHVADLGPRSVVVGPQAGAATFVLTGADNTTVPLCSSPLTNARGRIAGDVPLAIANTAN